MKLKAQKAVAIVLVIILVVCSMSGCGRNQENRVVGKWYNANGKCLDVRSDGTYELENDYGTGTWKYLDDGETIEFMDFYGQTIKTKVEIDEGGNYINWSNAGKFYNIEDIQNKELTSQGISVAKTAISPFSEDRALIEYEEISGKKYAAMIDTEGHILYKLENGSIEQDFSNRLNYIGDFKYKGFEGVAYINTDGSNTSCNIINKKGEVIATSDAMGFDDALTCGQGMVLVYKDNSNINGNQYCYGIIDSSGKWQIQLKDIGYYPNQARYAGCGVFIINAKKDFNEYKTILFNAYTGAYDIMSTDFKLEFIDDVAYYQDNNDCICINTDFEKEKISSCDYVTGNYLISKGEYLAITNGLTGKTAKFTAFKADQVSSITFKNNCGLVSLHGNDNNPYFTVIDGDGNMQFEPVKGWAYDWNEDVISHKDGDYGQCGMKTSGEVLFSNSEYLTFGYSNGIFTARANNDDDVWFYVNDRGEKILETLYE